MRRISRNHGMTALELLLVVAISTALASTLFKTFSDWRGRSVVSETHQEADIYLSALYEYYWRYCEIAPFPQPTYASLQSLNILVHKVAANPISNTEFIPSIEWAGTGRANAVLTLPFADADEAYRVAVASRGAELEGGSVVWRKSMSRLKSAHSGFKGKTETEIFAPNKCQG